MVAILVIGKCRGFSLICVFLFGGAFIINTGASDVQCQSTSGVIGGVGRIACVAPSDVMYMKWYRCDGRTCKEILLFEVIDNTSYPKVDTPGKLNHIFTRDGNALLLIYKLQKVDEALYRVEMHGEKDTLVGSVCLSVQDNIVFGSTFRPQSGSIGTRTKLASDVQCQSTSGVIGGVGRIACEAPSVVTYMKWYRCDGRTCKEILLFDVIDNTSYPKVDTSGKLNHIFTGDAKALLLINKLQKVDEAIYRVEMHGKKATVVGSVCLSVQDNTAFISTLRPRQIQAQSDSNGTRTKLGASVVLVVAVMWALIK